VMFAKGSLEELKRKRVECLRGRGMVAFMHR
jgi:hypothetical protein